MMDIMAQLSSEHAHLRTHLEQIQIAAESLDDAQLRVDLVAAQDALGEELDAHIRREEEEVFTIASAELGEEVVRPFKKEHQEVQALREVVYARLARGEVARADVLRLCDLILDHQQREDLMLFPSMNAALGAD